MSLDAFNKMFPPGTPVMYTDDFGSKEETATRSIARDVCGTAVVQLEGKAGCYDIDRISSLN